MRPPLPRVLAVVVCGVLAHAAATIAGWGTPFTIAGAAGPPRPLSTSEWLMLAALGFLALGAACAAYAWRPRSARSALAIAAWCVFCLITTVAVFFIASITAAVVNAGGARP
jgi:hypothetical protein